MKRALIVLVCLVGLIALGSWRANARFNDPKTAPRATSSSPEAVLLARP